MKTSVMTIVAGRPGHLRNQYRGLCESHILPDQWIIVSMNEGPPQLDHGKLDIVTARIDSENGALPLAAARNRAASLAEHENLIFLDVDCIPAPSLVSTFARRIKENRLLMGSVGYLRSELPTSDWTIAELEAEAEEHPLQPTLHVGKQQMSERYELFWSVCFGIHARTFEKLGGFDEGYTGYGGEDTDFAFQARQQGVEFGFIGARCFHQFHESESPPVKHLESIVANANRFFEKWNTWPMEDWLNQFAERGLVRFRPDEGVLTTRETLALRSGRAGGRD